MDVTEVLLLVCLNAVIDSILGVLIGLALVARYAGRNSKKALVDYLTSEESDGLWDRQTAKVTAALEPRIAKLEARIPRVDPEALGESLMKKLEPRISGLESRIAEPIQLDLAPVVEQVTANVRAEVDRVRADLDGRLGYLKKMGKQAGEAVTDLAIEGAMKAAGVDPSHPAVALQTELLALLEDPKWVKEHPAGAAGLRLLRSQVGNLPLTRSPSGRGSGEFG